MPETQPNEQRTRPTETSRRRQLRKRLFRRLGPLQAIDAIVFTEINNLPHPPAFDRLVARFSFLMTGGHAGAVVILLNAPRNPRVARRAVVGALPALWLTSFTVERVIKRFFRRRRPFIRLVRAIQVGRKPGSYSFPSGHAASSFAAATLMGIYFPRGTPWFRLVATMVGLSRIYLGVHYPGDVLIGGMTGAVLARIYRRMLLVIFRETS